MTAKHHPLFQLLFLILFLLSVSFFSSSSNAITVSRPRDFTFPAIHGELDRSARFSPIAHIIDIYPGGFAFEPGGTLSLNVSLASNTTTTTTAAQELQDAAMLLVVMPWETWRMIDLSQYHRFLGHTYYICETPSYVRFPLAFDSGTKVVIDRLPLLYTQKYSVLLVKCEVDDNMPAISLRVDGIEMINPTAQHLSLEQVSHMYMHSGIAAFYILVTCVIAIAAICCVRSPLLSCNHTVKLRGLLLLTAFARAVMAIVHYGYFLWLYHTGELLMYIAAIRDVSSVVSDTLLYAVMLLIAMGYCITRIKLTRNEIRAVTLTFAAYFVGRLFEASICQDASGFMEGTLGLVDGWWPSIDLFPRFCATFSVLRVVMQFILIFCIIIATVSG